MTTITDEDMARFQAAVLSLKEGSFVLEGDEVSFRTRVPIPVSPSTNFISLDEGLATVQLTGNGMHPGPNNLGGITLEGRADDISIDTDKRGNIRYEMNVQGAVLSARIVIELPYGSQRASAIVYPTFSGNDMTLTGVLLPTAMSNVFKGTAL
jgi:hypothetical protein